MRDKVRLKVSELLSSELELYRELEAQVDLEIKAIDSDDMDLLLEILQNKQSIISRQEMLMEKWADVSRDLGVSQGREEPVFWRALASVVGDEGYEDLKEKVRLLQDIVSSTLKSEELAQSNMGAKVSELRKRMSRVADGKKAVRGYMGSI
ncbi:flagellar export chaperone FlgN [Dethiosulfovibrio salsuginis]|uniref:FlgN protein n=1 Tax=Dethiosulfovibrio salsuginis TaxID=561720 RepID=A0A1X7KQ99_9BACT|nr:flagellar export chaperone FlgN [Dethiosulfovibrio salsuginis]SMG43783.1 FlgN protein [Dethiosulfovibrio salsuginis]